MKKTIVLFFTALVLVSSTIVSCKKEHQNETPAAAHVVNPHATARTAAGLKVTVSGRGYLEFSSPADADDYVDFLQTNTLGDVKAYHNDLGFTSMAGSKYDGLDQNSMLTDQQVKEFMLDASGLVAVQGTIFKPTGDNVYLLTMQADQLSNITYDALVSETFDANVMNRFATGQSRDSGFDLFQAIAQNPSGIGEYWTGPATTMKFWGSEHGCHDCYQVGTKWYKNCWTTYYRFFIAVYTDNTSEFMIPC